jgi:hypothetical protein
MSALLPTSASASFAAADPRRLEQLETEIKEFRKEVENLKGLFLVRHNR